jgi:hypothetical protein
LEFEGDTPTDHAERIMAHYGRENIAQPETVKSIIVEKLTGRGRSWEWKSASIDALLKQQWRG